MKFYINKPKTKQITFRITQQAYLAVKAIADKEEVSVPEVCRALIDFALKKDKT